MLTLVSTKMEHGQWSDLFSKDPDDVPARKSTKLKSQKISNIVRQLVKNF